MQYLGIALCYVASLDYRTGFIQSHSDSWLYTLSGSILYTQLQSGLKMMYYYKPFTTARKCNQQYNSIPQKCSTSAHTLLCGQFRLQNLHHPTSHRHLALHSIWLYQNCPEGLKIISYYMSLHLQRNVMSSTTLYHINLLPWQTLWQVASTFYTLSGSIRIALEVESHLLLHFPTPSMKSNQQYNSITQKYTTLANTLLSGQYLVHSIWLYPLYHNFTQA